MQAAQDDHAAFGVLAARCRPWVFGLCFRLVRDRDTAEDLVQETFLLALRDLAQLRQPERFRPWLASIAVNVCRMYLRRQRTRAQGLCASDADSPAAVDKGARAGDAPLHVEDALASLDAKSRRILMLFYREGLSQDEIAEMCELSRAAVKSRLHRARERLREEMLAMMSETEKERLGVSEEGRWALRTILLVEPEARVRSALRKVLKAAGYEVVALPTGEAAIEAIDQRRGQLLLLDKHCGEPHWLEVLTWLQADRWTRENVPMGVFIDGGSRRDVTLAWQAGAAICIARPPDSAEVVKFVQELAKVWPQQVSEECEE